MKCWPEPCTSLKDMFKNLSRRMDFHGNTDVLKICVVGMKSYPSLLSGVVLLLFVKVKNTLRCYSSYREFPGCSRLRFSTFCTPDFSAHTHIYIWPVCSTQDQDLHWCYNIVSLCWAKMNSINIISRHLTPLFFFSFIVFNSLYECRYENNKIILYQ